jgi:hypothetical protein
LLTSSTFSSVPRICWIVPTSCSVTYRAENSHPVDPVPVAIMMPLLLNFPISLSSTIILYMLVHETSFSAANTSFKQSLVVMTPDTGFSHVNSALFLKKCVNYPVCNFSRISTICLSLSSNLRYSLSRAPVRRVGSLLIPSNGYDGLSMIPADFKYVLSPPVMFKFL